ncbi:MAG: amidohydrolase [Chloroflexi bacterium]|nr:amidohydrolase [Chloroflexota bacterium]
MIIDWEHHASPEEVYAKRGRPGELQVKDGMIGMILVAEAYQIDKHLEFMDAAGIDMSVLSATLDAVEECRTTDDWYAKVMKEHPNRFVCFAPCIPTRGKPALEELDRAINVLGLKGVVISPQNDGEPLDSRKLWPFYEKVSRMKIPLYVHISNTPVGYDALNARYNLNTSMTREFDIAANTVRLIFGGVLTEFPELKIVMSHFGGGIAAILERVERSVPVLGIEPPFDKPYRANFRKYFDRIYFDMAGYYGGMNTVRCALTAIRPARLLFGTDYPYNFNNKPDEVRRYIDNIRNLGLSENDTEGMLGRNAAGLLGI